MEDTSEKTPLKSFIIEEKGHLQSVSSISVIKKYVKKNKDTILLELKEIIGLSASMILLIGLRMIFPLISSVMNGHLDKYHLDAVALANSLITLTCTGISGGFAYAVSTIFGHLLGHETFRKQMGTVLQRAMILFSLFAIVIVSIYLIIEPIFLLIGQNPIVSKLSSYYLTVWLPSAIFEILIMLLNRYLLVQKYKLPCIVISLIGLIINVSGQYILLNVYQLNYLYSAACQTMSYLVMLLLFLCYFRISKVYISTWEGFRPIEALQRWRPLLKFSLFGGLSSILHYSLLDVSLFCSGLLGINALSEYGVLYNLSLSIAVINSGFCAAMNIRLSSHLGNRDLHSFHILMKISILLLITINLIIFILIVSLRQILPMIYTNAPEIIDIASKHMIFMALMFLTSAFCYTTSNITTSSGRFFILAIVPFISNVLIGLPTGIALAFLTNLSVVGLLLGIAVALFFQGAIYSVFLWRMEWEKCTRLNEELGQDRSTQSSENIQENTSKLQCFKFEKSKNLFVKFLIIGSIILFLFISIILRSTVFRNICIPNEYVDLLNNMTRSKEMLKFCEHY